MTTSIRQIAIGLAMLGIGAAPALAQTSSPPVPSEPSTPPAGVPNDRGHGTESDRLSGSRGTIRPPAVDPGIQVPATGAVGTMPVIRPPGTPGGPPGPVSK